MNSLFVKSFVTFARTAQAAPMRHCFRNVSKHARPVNALQKNNRFKPEVLNPVPNRERFSASTTGLTGSERLLIDSIKRRTPKKKSAPVVFDGLSENPIVALSTAEEYNLDLISNHFAENGLYQLSTDRFNEFDDDDVLHFTAKYEPDNIKREFFVFREGTIVFWNMPSNECETVISSIRESETGSYDTEIVREEKEEIDLVQSNTLPTKLSNGLIYLNSENDVNLMRLEKFAFSNAIALSVKLSIWEANLDRYIDSIAYITQDMKEGRKIKLTRDQVFQKTGQLFGLRHRLNLSSDMLDTPDFYWDREDLEKIFTATYSHLNIHKRTRVMNEKLNHCIELMDLLAAHLNDNHHVRLEWMIIGLIMIEVGFETIHYLERFVGH